jgi:shikimate kinase
LRLAVVGMPGCGKSTVGRHLARQLGLRFLDSDHEIETALGMPIRDLFERNGEDAFRDLEQETIEALTQLPGVLLATGGGAVLRPSNRDALHSRCHVIYLRATPEELFRRLRHDSQRPLLQVQDPQQRLRELYRERDPLYRRTAHFIVEAARPSVPALLSMVLMQLELAGLVDPAAVPGAVDPVPAAQQTAGIATSAAPRATVQNDPEPRH